jgi:PAP2 superfamily
MAAFISAPSTARSTATASRSKLRYRLRVLAVVVSCVLVCGALVAWARATADAVRIPAVHSPWFGLALLLAGAIIGLAGAPLFPHPVYTGFCIVCAGVSIAVGSASGLWLVSPVVALSCAALVLGHETRDPLLPGPGTSPPTGNDRLRFYLFVLLPWLALYEVILALGIPPDAISGMSRFEQRLPVLEWSQIFYASTYLMTLCAPVVAKTRNDLRNYSVRAWWTMLVAYPAFLLIPLIAPKRPFTPHTLPGRLLLWERTLDSPVAAFPSFHVIWAMLAAEVFARRWPRLKVLFYGWAILVAASCVTTSQHSILDVLGGAATVALVVRGPGIWAALRAQRPVCLLCWNIAIMLILTRLWLLSAPLQLIAGLFFILSGLGRFVEEASLVEPRRRLYRWTAIASVIAGAFLTALGSGAPAPGVIARSHLSF